ncbi:amino acid permease [Actinosynnema mirum]|uniref:amino acid permease n=1 Tax=Actinosynnema mirum TaxID=40567 RepID=UPI00117FECD5|nr:amino acid permease [Actinosynnema mirum]
MTHRSGAVVLVLGASLGAGVLAGFTPAAALAGPLAPLALLVAGIAALCCATASAAAPATTGHLHVRAQLGPWPARITAAARLTSAAGVGAAVAHAVAATAAPQHRLPLALALLACVTALGGRWPARATRLLTGFVVVALLLVVVVCLAVAPPANPVVLGAELGIEGVMGAASVLFLVFTGYERITEAGDPALAGPLRRFAAPAGVLLSLLLAAALWFALRHQLGDARLALSRAPLRDALLVADGGWLLPVLGLAALAAGVQVLVFVLAGARRALAGLVESGDLPKVRGRWTPHLAASGLALVAVLALTPTQALAVGACASLFHGCFTSAATRVMLQDDGGGAARAACLGLGLSVLLAMGAPADALAVVGAALALGTGLLGYAAHTGAKRAAARADSAPESRDDGVLRPR